MASFLRSITADSAEEAFDKAKETGSGVGEKNEFELRKENPLPRPAARTFAVSDFQHAEGEGPAFCVPFHDSDLETVAFEHRVRAPSPDDAVAEALERSEYERDDFSELSTYPMLAKKGYTAKLDKSEHVEKSTTYEVVSPGSRKCLVDVTPEAAENLPNALFDWGQYTGPEGEYDSFREARSAIMTHFAVLPEDDTEYEIHEIKQRTDVTKFSSKCAASEVSTWDVKFDGKLDGGTSETTDGFFFYGYTRK